MASETGNALPPSNDLQAFTAHRNIIHVASSCSIIASKIGKLMQHEDFDKDPQPGWIVRTMALYQSEKKAAGCSSGGTPVTGSSSPETPSPVVLVTSGNPGSCDAGQAARITNKIDKLKQHRNFGDNPQPGWIVRTMALYQSEMKAAGCSSSGKTTPTNGSTPNPPTVTPVASGDAGSCNSAKAALVTTKIDKLKQHRNFGDNPQPGWIVRTMALYQSEMKAAGCSSSGKTTPTNGSPGGEIGPVPTGTLPWRSGMSCTRLKDAGIWRGTPMTAAIGWAPHKKGWEEMLAYFSGSNMEKFINARKSKALPSIGLPMMPASHSGQLDNCAAGKFDNYFTKFATILKNRGLGDIALRVGWEANLQSYPWIAEHNIAGYKACYRRIVKTLRAVSPDFIFDWHNGKRTRFANTPADLYPGDDVVDIVGLSYYDRDLNNRTQADWDRSASDGSVTNPHGIETWLAFAKSHGKKLGVAEWGITNRGDTPYYQGSGDNALYIKNMYNFFKKNAKDIAYESYFNCVQGNPQVYILYPSNYNPLSSAMYRSLF
ncbi:MAG: hypothetical protein H6851_18205 [Geminicoccaceae bacterium]|nr:hypothetical protein [Geminicoccaceae bacterium]